MEVLSNIYLSFSVAMQMENLFYCFLGVLIGTLIGVLPGLGPAATISILFPLTLKISPTAGVIMLAGIYYGAQYGGSTTSILVNIPGEAASVVTCLDGYQMARQGRAGPALGMAAFASFIAGSLATLFIVLIAPPLARFSLKFGPPEYFALMSLGLILLTYLSSGSMLKALMMASLGIFLGTIGVDPISGYERLTFGSYTLMDGLGLVPVIMGIFGISEVLINLEQSIKRDLYKTHISQLFPNLRDWKDSIPAILRGSTVGFLLGALPGGGAILASFASYAIEKKISREPERFGKGAIKGVAAPESANNAASQGGFIPLLSMGIPANAIMAILMGVLMIHGIRPGPLLMKQHPEVFWGVIGSMYIGNWMLLVLNLPLIGIWVKILKIPYAILFPLILLFCVIGSYSLNNNLVEVGIMIVFGVVGYFMKKHDYEGAPLILAFVLCPLIENALRQSLMMSHGKFTIFLERPISLGFVALSAFLLFSPLLREVGKRVGAGLRT